MLRFSSCRWLGVVLLLLAPAAGHAEKLVSVDVDGTRFKASLDSGRVLDSEALVAAEIEIGLAGGERRRIRIVSVERYADDPAGEVLLHHMQVKDAEGNWGELCRPDAAGASWSFPLRGQWDSEGRRVSEDSLTLACAADAIGKCVRFGYKPWKTGSDGGALAEYHAACIKAVRADYCGDHATTRDGQLIDIYDAASIQRRDATRAYAGLPFEAAFSPAGAVCVAHTRVPANMTLPGLAASCARLADHLGPARCREDAATAGHYGRALIFIRSPEGETDPEPPQAQSPASGPAGSSGRSDSNNPGD